MSRTTLDTIREERLKPLMDLHGAVDPTLYTHYMSSLSEDPKFQIIGSTRTADGVLQLVEHMVGRPLVNNEERKKYLAVFMKSDPSTLSPEVLSELTSRGLLGEST